VATFVFKNAEVHLGASTGNRITANVVSVTVTQDVETQDETAMGDNSRSYLGGLKTWSVELEVLQDFAAGVLDADITTIMGTSGRFYCRATTGAVGATNPSYSGVVICQSYTPVSGTVGDVAKASISLIGKGDLTRDTST